MPELAPGAAFADHEIVDVAGRGGMGIVYRAFDVQLEREVALKVIAPELSADPQFRERFRLECKAAASIHHPNVIPIWEAGEEQGMLYVTMRYVEGTDLRQLVLDEGRLEPDLAVDIAAQVAAALGAAHAQGMVHRDVKPPNVLIAREGAATQAFLTDFGLAKIHGASGFTRTGMIVGTLDYIAPEQLKEQRVDARTDVYALGCVVYHALTGEVPYPREGSAAKMFAHIGVAPPSAAEVVPETPRALDEVLRRAMAKDPEDRYPSTADFAQAALGAVEGASSGRSMVRGSTAVSSRTPIAAAPDQAAIPFPSALEPGGDESPFVGREDALERLRKRYELVRAGERQFVVLSGEPGIGKTRLVTELAREAHAGKAVVLYGRSDEESLLPYQPFVTALQHYIAHSGSLDFDEELKPELGELALLIPELRRHIPELRSPLHAEPDTSRFLLFEAVARLLCRISTDRPVVLVLDDMHWADKSTVLLLKHIVSDVRPARLMLVVTHRDAPVGEDFVELLAQQRRRSAFEEVSLHGLDEGATTGLVAARGHGRTTPRVISLLREETEGNPFFIEETLRTLAEVETPDDGGALSEAALQHVAVPEGVKAMIGRRLAHLDSTTTHLLEVAAVVGREFRLAVLEALVQGPGEQPMSALEIISALEEAIGVRLVREVESEVDTFSFLHALVREALYERQLGSRRVRRHHRVGEALEALEASHARVPVKPAELAHHFFEARHVGGAEKALGYALRAGADAAGSHAYEDAAEQYRRALELLELQAPPDEHQRCEALLSLGSVQWQAGDPEARETFVRAADVARRRQSPEQLARAAMGFAGPVFEAGIVDQDAITLLEEAGQALGDVQSPLRARLLARLSDSLLFTGDEERTAALSRIAVEMARQGRDTEALLTALRSSHAARLHIAHLDERLEISGQLVALAKESGYPEFQALGHSRRVNDLIEAADVEEARREHAELTRLAEDLRQPLYRHLAVTWEAVFALMAGRFEEAESLGRTAYELATQAQMRDAEARFGAQVAMLRLLEGRLPELVPAIESFVEQSPALVAWRALLALAQLQAGARDRAVEEFARLVDDDFTDVPRDMFWLTAVCLLAETCGSIGDAARARVLYEALLPYRERNVEVGWVACLGSVERFLGLLATAMADWDRATQHYEAALHRNVTCGIRPVVALVHRDHAEMLLARRGPGDLERSSKLLRDALEAAEELAMSVVAERIRARLDEVAQEPDSGKHPQLAG